MTFTGSCGKVSCHLVNRGPVGLSDEKKVAQVMSPLTGCGHAKYELRSTQSQPETSDHALEMGVLFEFIKKCFKDMQISFGQI